MTGLLLLKEHLKEFYNKYSYWIRFVVRLLLVLCTVLSMNANIGYMTKLKNPAVVLLLCVFGALLPDSASVFLMGCVMVAHVYAVSMEMALITLMMILVVAVLYYGFKPGDSWLMVLTPLAFLFKVPYAVAFLVGLGGSLISVIPVNCGVFLYYLLMYIRQNAGVLTGEGNVDIVQRYSQIIRSVCFNQTMMIMIAACAVGIIVVYLIHRLSVDYAWVIAIVVGTVAQLLVIFVCVFGFGVSVSAGTLIFGLLVSVVLAMIYNFFFFSVDYTCTEYVQFEDDDYYYYVKAIPKVAMTTPEKTVKKINERQETEIIDAEAVKRLSQDTAEEETKAIDLEVHAGHGQKREAERKPSYGDADYRSPAQIRASQARKHSPKRGPAPKKHDMKDVDKMLLTQSLENEFHAGNRRKR